MWRDKLMLATLITICVLGVALALFLSYQRPHESAEAATPLAPGKQTQIEQDRARVEFIGDSVNKDRLAAYLVRVDQCEYLVIAGGTSVAVTPLPCGGKVTP